MTTTRLRPGWILGPRADALIFSGPIVVGLLLIAGFHAVGLLHADMPPWLFALLVVAVDVGHVWATAFRVYLDPVRFRRRPGLYVGVPVAVAAGGLVLYSFGADVFWRVLAYLAVFHFVRQQWGWVAYTRRRAGEGAVDRVLDEVAIYNATLFPLLFWHANLPRAIAWFVDGDFVALPAWTSGVGLAVHWTINAVYVARQLQHLARGRGVNVAKLQVWVTTWIAWYGGIVLLESDVAFTALNVLSHGVPYLAVVWHVEAAQGRAVGTPLGWLFRPGLALVFVGALVAIGYAEEWLWDGLVWRDNPGLFPGAPDPAGPALLAVVVPLLAVPQATHYVLDGWLWRTAAHDDVRRLLDRG